MPTGTYSIDTLLAARNQSAASFGLDNIQAILAADLAAYNAVVDEMFGELCEVSKDRQRVYGSSTDGAMVEVDEFGKAPTQNATVGSQVAFPLRKFQFPIGWTADWFKKHTPADMAIQMQDAQIAHQKMLKREIARALFGAANYSFTDRFVDNVSLSIKRLVNADSAAIPNDPFGNAFDASTHSHYNGTASFVVGDLDTQITDLVEHGHGAGVKIAINRAQASTVLGFSGVLESRFDNVILSANSDAFAVRRDAGNIKLDDYTAGTYKGAEIVVRPWVPAGYVFVWASGDSRKPVVLRRDTDADGNMPGLTLAAEYADHPLYAKTFEMYVGAGVYHRTNGVALFTTNATYSSPTIS